MYSKTSLYRHHQELGILAVDRGMEFCQLHVDIEGHVCTIGDKNSIYIVLSGNSVDVMADIVGCYQFAKKSLIF